MKIEAQPIMSFLLLLQISKESDNKHIFIFHMHFTTFFTYYKAHVV